MLEFWFDPESKYYRGGLDFGERYVVYCAGGGRSALAADLLQDLGYTNVAHLTVGFNGWKEAGGAVEQVRPDPKYLTSHERRAGTAEGVQGGRVNMLG